MTYMSNAPTPGSTVYGHSGGVTAVVCASARLELDSDAAESCRFLASR
jgi:malonyl CoA-acyl carrier protein transacylase